MDTSELIKTVGGTTGVGAVVGVLFWVVRNIREGLDANTKALVALRIALAKRGITSPEDDS